MTEAGRFSSLKRLRFAMLSFTAISPVSSALTPSLDLEKADLDTVYKTLGTSAKGLTSAEAKERIDKYGRNELVDKEASDLEKFLAFFWGPIAWMIEAAALLSLLMGHWADLTIIMGSKRRLKPRSQSLQKVPKLSLASMPSAIPHYWSFLFWGVLSGF
jgi:hypothetical protein